MGTSFSKPIKKKKPEILYLILTSFVSIGGIEKMNKVWMSVLTSLYKKGKININFLSVYDINPDEKYVEKSLFKGYKGNKIYFVLSALIRSLRSDLIILSHIHLALIGLLIKIISPKKKIILIAHGIEIWKNPSGLKERVIYQCDQIVAVSNFTKEKIMDCYNVPGYKIKVLNNCLDPYIAIKNNIKDTAVKNGMMNNNTYQLLTVSRLSYDEQYKGYDKVLEALAILKEKGNQFNYYLVGKYDEKEKKRVSNLIEKLNLQNEVRITGYLSQMELDEYYQSADVFVMPSKEEGFGLVFIEAMAHGIPTIGGNQDGSKDALMNGALGRLVDPDNVEDIALAIEQELAKKDDHVYRNHLSMTTIQTFSFDSYKDRVKKIVLDNA